VTAALFSSKLGSYTVQPDQASQMHHDPAAAKRATDEAGDRGSTNARLE
jgi:hypothetical protein